VGVKRIFSPDTVRKSIVESSREALKYWKLNYPNTQKWDNYNIASEQVFRIIGFIIIIFSLLCIYAIFKTLLKG
jgi:hypothetical protein